MLYILPRVVLQVKASLYYKTINNKKKKTYFILPCGSRVFLGREGTRAAPGAGWKQPELGVTSCPASPGSPSVGTEAVAAPCPPRAQETAGVGSGLLMPKALPRPVSPSASLAPAGRAAGCPARWQQDLTATGQASFWYC